MYVVRRRCGFGDEAGLRVFSSVNPCPGKTPVSTETLAAACAAGRDAAILRVFEGFISIQWQITKDVAHKLSPVESFGSGFCRSFADLKLTYLNREILTTPAIAGRETFAANVGHS
jgi:hypothetical protein